jgi:hypothetical protein
VKFSHEKLKFLKRLYAKREWALGSVNVQDLAQNSGPIAGATITFYINGAAFSAVTDSGGVAIYNFSTRTADTALSIYATYGGNGTLLGSISATRVINKL